MLQKVGGQSSGGGLKTKHTKKSPVKLPLCSYLLPLLDLTPLGCLSFPTMEIILAERGLNALAAEHLQGGQASECNLLNLSENNFNSCHLLDTFTSLQTLILDKN